MNLPRDFALQLGALITLYISLTGLLLVLFNVINLALPDVTDTYWNVDSYQSTARIGIAMLVVFFPTYIVLTRMVNQFRRTATDGAYLTLTRWLIYLSLVVGGGVLLGDLVVIIMSFLEGELTTRFMLKAGTLLLVVGTAFYYYLNDARGKWIENERGSLTFGAIASCMVIASIVFGFYHIDSPQTVRERDIDRTQITDLQEMQVQITNHLQSEGELPDTLADLYITTERPTASVGRSDYEYTIGENQFALCAEFAHPSPGTTRPSLARPFPEDRDRYIVNPDDWTYEAGRYCFERKVQSSEETAE